LAVARRKVPRRAETAWRKRNITRKECTKANVVQEIQRGRTFGRRRQQEPECSNGIRSRGTEEQVHLRNGKKTTKSIGGRRRHQSRLESMTNANKVFRKTMGLEFGKRAFGNLSGIRRRWDWSLWEGRSPPKQKRNGVSFVLLAVWGRALSCKSNSGKSSSILRIAPTCSMRLPFVRPS
jgi:hypothetical protein